MSEICGCCGGKEFTEIDGFYYCGLCGTQSQNLRNLEADEPISSRGLMKAKTKKSGTVGKEKKVTRNNEAILNERALKNIDFPPHLQTMGYRLCTFSKLVTKISKILENRYNVRPNCVKYSTLVMQAYFRNFGVAFCDEELARDESERYKPLLHVSKREIDKQKMCEMKKETAKREAEKKKRRSTMSAWEMATQEVEKAAILKMKDLQIDSHKRIETQLSISSVRAAFYIYLGIDMVLVVVYMGALLAGCKWIQLSDLFRWYREGRFDVTKTALTALQSSGDCEQEGLPFSETTSTYKPDYYQPPYEAVLSRMVYNLELPTVFLRRLHHLYRLLPPVNVDVGHRSFANTLPLIADVRERIMAREIMGPVSFFVGNFGDRFGLCWQLIPPEAKAAALILLALKLCFGLRDGMENRLKPRVIGDGDEMVTDEDRPGSNVRRMFDFGTWLRQLKFRMLTWQGRNLAEVLKESFIPEPPVRDRDVSKRVAPKAYFCIQRRTAFADSCVPSRLHCIAEKTRFEELFGESGAFDYSKEALFAPLKFQAVTNRSFLKKFYDTEKAASSLDPDPIDPSRVDAFFASFTDAHMDFELDGDDEDASAVKELDELSFLFPCAKHYARHPPMQAIPALIASEFCGILRTPICSVQSIICKETLKELLTSSLRFFSPRFADLLAHFAIICGEMEPLLYFTFLLVESMIFDRPNELADQLRAENFVLIAERGFYNLGIRHDYHLGLADDACRSGPVREFQFVLKISRSGRCESDVSTYSSSDDGSEGDDGILEAGRDEPFVDLETNVAAKMWTKGREIRLRRDEPPSDESDEERKTGANKSGKRRMKMFHIPQKTMLQILSFKYW